MNILEYKFGDHEPDKPISSLQAEVMKDIRHRISIEPDPAEPTVNPQTTSTKDMKPQLSDVLFEEEK